MRRSRPATTPNPTGAARTAPSRRVVALAAVVVVAAGAAVWYGVSRASPPKLSDGTDPAAADPDLREVAPGVKVRDLKAGTGPECPPGAVVRLHYTGWLTDGRVFDTSHASARPVEMPLGGAIPGWQEGIPGMRAGGVRKLVVEPKQGYGARRVGGVPPNATLVYEVELVEVVPEAAPGGPAALADGTAPWAADAGLRDLGDGLMVRDLAAGAGPECPPGATVTVHFTGWLPDGTPFDSTRPSGKAAVFPLPLLSPGLQRGVPGMKAGGVRKFVVPAALGYGKRGAPPRVPPDTPVVFELELVSFR
jgi:peptidylprolyl isomerase